MRWLLALIVIVVFVALGAFFWPTIDRTIVAPHVAQAPAPASAPAPVAQNPPPAAPPASGSQTSRSEPAPTAQSAPAAPAPTAQTAPAAPPPAPAAQTSPSAPPSAPVAQSSPPASAPAAGSQTSPSASAPASAGSAPAPAQTPSPAPAAPAAESAGAPAGQASNETPGSGDKAATELASLKPGFGAKDLVSTLNDSKFDFASASAEVPAEMTDFLKRAADEMKRLPPGHALEIAGYTDSSGNPAKNVTLSQKRAEAVREALIKDGVNPDMLVAKGYGSADPIAGNDTPEGRARNRRIEFHVARTP